MRRFDHWIFDSYRVTPEGLALYRIAYALFSLVVIAPGHWAATSFQTVSRFPFAFFQPPPGPMMIAGGFPPEEVMIAVVVLLHMSLVALLIGYRTRLASWLTGILLLVGFGFLFSFGKVNHVLLYVAVPLVMSASNWGAAYSADAVSERVHDGDVPAWPLTFLALLVGFGMFTAGFTKLIGGWLDPSTQAVQGHLVKQFYTHARQDFLAPVFLDVHHTLFWEVLDYATVFFEIGFLAAVASAWSTRLFAVLAVGFHFSSMLMLNIAFVPNLIVYAAFIEWARLRAPRLDAASPRAQRWARAPWVLVLVGLAGGLSAYAGSPLRWLDPLATFSSDLTLTEVVAQIVALVVTAALVFQALRTRRAPHSVAS